MISGRPDAGRPPAARHDELIRILADQFGLRVRLADLNLARLRLLQDRNPDLQDAVAVVGLDGLGVQVLRQAHAARDGARPALPHDELLAGVLAPLVGPRDADRQDTAVHGDLDRVGVDAGNVEPQLDVALAAYRVHRHAGGRAERGPGQPVELTLKIPGKRVKSCQIHPCLTSEGFSGGVRRRSTTSPLYWQGTYNSTCIFPRLRIGGLPGSGAVRRAGRTAWNEPWRRADRAAGGA